MWKLGNTIQELKNQKENRTGSGKHVGINEDELTTTAHGLWGQGDSTQLEASQGPITKMILSSHSYYKMSKIGHHFPHWLAVTHLAQRYAVWGFE